MSETPVEERPTTDEKPSSPPGRRRWPKWLAGILVLLGVTIALLPFGLEWGVEMALEKAGAVNVDVEDVDFNPFTGELVVKSLKSGGAPGEELGLARAALEIDWRTLWKKRLQVRKLALQGAVIDLKQAADGTWSVGSLSFGGPQQESPPEPVAEEKGTPWGLGITELALDEVLIRYADPQLKNQFRFERLHLSKIFTWSPDDDTPFDIVLHLTEGTVALKGDSRPFAGEKLVQAEIDVADLDLSWLAPLLKAHEVSGFAGTLSAHTRIKVVIRTDGLEAETEGRLGLDGLKAVHPQADVTRAGVAWNGTSFLQLAGEGSAPDLRVRGKLSSTDLDLKLSAMPLHIRQKNLECDADVRFGADGALAAAADLALTGLRIDDLQKKKTALELGSLNLKGVRYSGPEQVEVERLQLGEVHLLERPVDAAAMEDDRFSAAFSRLAVEAARFTGNSLEIGTVDLEKADLRVARDAQGELDLTAWLPKSETAEEAPAPEEAGAETRGLAVRIARVKVAGNSRLAFSDASVSPAFHQTLQPIDIDIEKIDTSDKAKSSPLAVHLGIGRYGLLDATGQVVIFSDRPTMDLKGSLQGVDLPQVNPYAAQSLGYLLKQGQLGVEVTWRADQGELDSLIALQIDRLELEKTGTEGNGLLRQAMGMPVGTALSLLKDRDENIRLKLPIRGDMENPDFSLGNLVFSATTKAVQKAAVSYFAPLGVTLLTGVVLPPGTLLVAGKVAEWALTMRFDPVVFSPMQRSPDADSLAYLDRMAGLLKDRPKTQVIVCGKANRRDLQAHRASRLAEPAVKPEAGKGPAPDQSAVQAGLPITSEEEVLLAKLAEQRAYAVKDHLISKGVEAGRLLLCVPMVALESEELPVVEVSM